MQQAGPCRKGWVVGIAVVGALAIGQLHAQQATPPAGARPQGPVVTRPAPRLPPSAQAVRQLPPTAVILRTGSGAEALRQLDVRRRITPAQLRANPVIALQDGQADLRSVLANPASLANVAERLKRQPALARVTADRMEVMQVAQGLIVHQTLSYRLATGACTDPRKRASVAALGVDCFTRLSPSAHAAAFSDPANIRYVADPRRRGEALATAREAALAEQADVTSGLAQFRAALREPARRAEIEREFGAAEIARLEALDDAALEEEMVNAAEVEIEELMFVPDRRRLSGASLAPSGMLASIGGDPADDASSGAGLPLLRPLPGLSMSQRAEHRIEDRIYLTGFTLGREHEWRKGVSVSINWCLLGCKKTYYAGLYARFNYGFGLRFPVKMGGSYRYTARGSERTATFTPVFRTINGSADDYLAAGLPRGKLFDGKELVLQTGAEAGLEYRLPVVGSNRIGFSINVDLTDSLPAPYASGQFMPPMPGQASPPVTLTFDKLDLIGGLANLGIAGGKVFPAIEFNLSSNRLEFRLTDKRTRKIQTMSTSGQAYPLSLDPDKRLSEFTIGDPVYDLAFSMTPGVVARLFVDVRLWSHDWEWPVWFPQLTVELPPGGQRFSCHAGTMCTRDYRVGASGADEFDGLNADPAERIPAEWADTYIASWKPYCREETPNLCAIAITSLYTTYRHRMTAEMRAADDPRQMGRIHDRLAREAHDKAIAIVKESAQRAARR